MQSLDVHGSIARDSATRRYVLTDTGRAVLDMLLERGRDQAGPMTASRRRRNGARPNRIAAVSHSAPPGRRHCVSSTWDRMS